ncbi:HSP70-domain-containing protein [Coniophora puteana RWD-64-598 SS2]|uniref:HSP70-domain-containing protein n=1 Tax=Coniophora puteana (strain RWD-64-598) TaxID=741705 RepID=A0A5M3MHS6_CONPW|nr:HSP70-domain-containing protein [Coniophora puteana RWD-64-598 SS2]EIW78181.1 HSP70-domain-containing protein [Coniophora puteana RWD-64-598 SS2]
MSNLNVIRADLGSMYSRAAVLRDGAVEVIAMIPSPSSNPNPQSLDKTWKEDLTQLFQTFKERADAYLDHNFSHLTFIAVPKRYGDTERQAVKSAAKDVGLDVFRVIYEPVAVTNAYGFKNTSGIYNVLVFDLEGVTCDVTLLEIDDGVPEILASASDSDFVGERLNGGLVEDLAQANEDQRGSPASADRSSDIAGRSSSQGVHQAPTCEGDDASIPGSMLELVEHSIFLVYQVLKEANVAREELDKIILTGGSPYMPVIQKLLHEHLSKDVSTDVNPEEAAVRGAAIQGYGISRPVDTTELLRQIWPHSLGIETCDGIVRYIPEFPILPFCRTYNFSTSDDNQTSVRIALLSGDRDLASENLLKESFELKGIAPAPRGASQVEVTFDIDNNYYLRVSARDRGTSASVGFSAFDDIWFQRVIEDAEWFSGQFILGGNGIDCLPSGHATVTDGKDPDRPSVRDEL